jgi:simple sugar transport system permease protein
VRAILALPLIGPLYARARGRLAVRLPRELGVLLSLVLVAAGFQLVSESRFIEAQTWGNILLLSVEIGLVAIGVTLLMIAGEFDLSVGSNFAFSGMLFALLVVQLHWAPGVAFLVTLAAASAIGGLNALVTLVTGIPSFISTLGALMIWRGLVLAVSGGWPLSLEDEPARMLRALAGPFTENLTYSVFWWAGAAFLLHLVLRHSALGNWIMATGGNPQAARASGVPVRRVKVLVFMLTGALAGLAGMIQFARLGSFSPTYGEGLELQAIVAAVIGGTLLTGGVGGIPGTVLGTLLIGMISSGLVLVGAPVYWFRTFVGVILVLAVVFNRWVSERGRA